MNLENLCFDKNLDFVVCLLRVVKNFTCALLTKLNDKSHLPGATLKHRQSVVYSFAGLSELLITTASVKLQGSEKYNSLIKDEKRSENGWNLILLHMSGPVVQLSSPGRVEHLGD